MFSLGLHHGRALYHLGSLVPRLPSPGNEKRAKTEGSLVEFKSRAPLPFEWPGPHQRSHQSSLRRATFDAGPDTQTE